MTLDEIRKSLADDLDALYAIDINVPEGQRDFWTQYEKVRGGISNIMPYLLPNVATAALQESLNMIENQMKPKALEGDVTHFKYIKDTLDWHTERFR